MYMYIPYYTRSDDHDICHYTALWISDFLYLEHILSVETGSSHCTCVLYSTLVVRSIYNICTCIKCHYRMLTVYSLHNFSRRSDAWANSITSTCMFLIICIIYQYQEQFSLLGITLFISFCWMNKTMRVGYTEARTCRCVTRPCLSHSCGHCQIVYTTDLANTPAVCMVCACPMYI